MQPTTEHVNNIAGVAGITTPLIEQYRPHSDVFFTSKENTLLAKPPFASLLLAGTKNLAEQASESLRFAKELGFKHPVVIGAVPFDINRPAHLRVSTNIATAIGLEHLKTLQPLQTQNISEQEATVTPYPTPEIFKHSVQNALERFARGELDKVVLSRTLDVNYPSAPNTHALLKNLAVKNTQGFTFAIDLKGVEQSERVHTLVGASPELLIARKGQRVYAHPLAGSEPRSQDPVLDRARAEQLLQSEKDLREHALVIKAIKSALSPFCKTLNIPEKPSLVATETLWHLGTHIEGELADLTTSALTLALAIHPTPAVCGYPTQAAFNAIQELENYERDLFTGMVGWCNSDGDGEWVVTIRCAQVDDCQVRLYAGAGIVAGSNPEKETAETAAKFNTLLNAMGVKQ
ncbi:MAG TPA: isochorismate synthase [Marinagarivorans sp.]